MTFQESIRTVYIDKYATFSGRAPRSEYWWSVPLFYLVIFALNATSYFMMEIDPNGGEPSIFFYVLLSIFGIIILALLIPFISVTVRRYHDMNLSGWIYLLLFLASLIPTIGIIAYIAEFVIVILKGTDGSNKFGDDPLIERISEKIFE